ncbi:hypothetical protein [Nonomuraea sp. NPDC050310]|uniref:hypothetical protein n=1 Tax=Nonomuraea sp. NPDC050310 TaxID=3154935 RepID=UPI0033ED4B81
MLGIILIGTRFLLQPFASAACYGTLVPVNAFPPAPSPQASSSTTTFAPLSDMLAVLKNKGPQEGAHGLTAAVTAAAAVVLILGCGVPRTPSHHGYYVIIRTCLLSPPPPAPGSSAN